MIGGYGSVAVAGLAKNVGKTVTLRHLLREGTRRGLRLGVTSIGVDGESIDSVSATRKPEITLYPGVVFATSEAHYRRRRLQSEVTGVARRHTALGRVVVAKALSAGKTLLSGPADTTSLREVIWMLRSEGAGTVLVDGALSRLSPASPAVTDAMVLATGAALSPEISRIVSRTSFVCSLTELPEVDSPLGKSLEGLEGDLWGIDEEKTPRALGIGSALSLDRVKEGILRFGTVIFNPGIVSDKLLSFLSSLSQIKDITLIVRDFTRLFVQPHTLKVYLGKGGSIKVLERPRLLGVTVNPYSPAGYQVDKDRLVGSLQASLNVPVEYITPEP